jgi:hypothetical protein
MSDLNDAILEEARRFLAGEPVWTSGSPWETTVRFENGVSLVAVVSAHSRAQAEARAAAILACLKRQDVKPLVTTAWLAMPGS